MAATNSSRILSSTGCLSTADGNRILANRMAANGNRAIPLRSRASTNFYRVFTNCMTTDSYSIRFLCCGLRADLYRPLSHRMATDCNSTIVFSCCTRTDGCTIRFESNRSVAESRRIISLRLGRRTYSRRILP